MGSTVALSPDRSDPLYAPPVRCAARHPSADRPSAKPRAAAMASRGVSGAVLIRKELKGASGLHERPRHVAGVVDPQDRHRSVPMCERGWGIPAWRLDASQPAEEPSNGTLKLPPRQMWQHFWSSGRRRGCEAPGSIPGSASSPGSATADPVLAERIRKVINEVRATSHLKATIVRVTAGDQEIITEAR